MSDDILAQIDAAVADATSCFCGCPRTITAGGASAWFASEDCQIRWNERRLAAMKPRESASTAASEPPLLPSVLTEAEFMRELHTALDEHAAAVATWPVHPASPYLTREDITGQPDDEVVRAFRAEVRRQGLDVSTIQVEALRPVGMQRLDPVRVETTEPWVHPLDRFSPECAWRTPMCSGWDGTTARSGPCQHECHGGIAFGVIAGRGPAEEVEAERNRFIQRLCDELDLREPAAPRRPWWNPRRWFG